MSLRGIAPSWFPWLAGSWSAKLIHPKSSALFPTVYGANTSRSYHLLCLDSIFSNFSMRWPRLSSHLLVRSMMFRLLWRKEDTSGSSTKFSKIKYIIRAMAISTFSWGGSLRRICPFTTFLWLLGFYYRQAASNSLERCWKWSICSWKNATHHQRKG